uniref:Thioredoxin domain-containing protein n=1 Tax=Pseudonaja textilis TaxID=8673 RepID=A0A670ZW49_PSETE
MVVNNQEHWEEFLGSKGLIVVDAYQGWCGPCKTVVNLFKKIRNEVGGDLLHFAVAEVDSIDALEKYRGKCEPTFLFYGSSMLSAYATVSNYPIWLIYIIRMECHIPQPDPAIMSPTHALLNKIQLV